MKSKAFRRDFRLIGPSVEEFRSRNTLDRYGFSWLLSNKLKLRSPKRSFSSVWQHGIYFHSPNGDRIIEKYRLSKSDNHTSRYVIVVANEDDCRFVKASGYKNVITGGMPFSYTNNSGISRRNALLAIVAHSGEYEEEKVNLDDEYLDYLWQFKSDYEELIICAYLFDSDSTFYTKALKMGFQVVCGAHPNDKNSLMRTRALFDYASDVTSNSHGSHIYYALSCGCRTSICGPILEVQHSSEYKGFNLQKVNDINAIRQFYTINNSDKNNICLVSDKPMDGIIDIPIGRKVIGSDFTINDRRVLTSVLRWDKTSQLVGYTLGAKNRFLRKYYKQPLSN